MHGAASHAVEARQRGLGLQSRPAVEGNDDRQLAVVGQQSGDGRHQFAVGQRRGVARQCALGVWTLERIDKVRRIADDGVEGSVGKALYVGFYDMDAVGERRVGNVTVCLKDCGVVDVDASNHGGRTTLRQHQRY